MANLARGKQIAGEVRGAYLRAFKQLEQKGRPISSLVLEQLEENPLKALELLAKFTPRELMLEGEVGVAPSVINMQVNVVQVEGKTEILDHDPLEGLKVVKAVG